MEEQLGGNENSESINMRNMGTLVMPIAAFHPKIGLVQGGNIAEFLDLSKDRLMANQQLKVGGDEGSVEMPVNVADGDNTLRSDNEQQIVVPGLDGSYLMDKNKWPKLTLPSEAIETDPTEALTQEESLISGANKGGGLDSSDISKGVSHHSDVF